MPPANPPVPANVAEPPHERTPDGRWADRLRAEFLAAAADLDEAQTIGELRFFPDRTWHGYTYIPLSGTTQSGNEVYGYVRFVAGTDGRDQADFTAYADFTEETAERNPDWRLDLSDEVVGSWRGADDAGRADDAGVGHRPDRGRRGRDGRARRAHRRSVRRSSTGASRCSPPTTSPASCSRCGCTTPTTPSWRASRSTPTIEARVSSCAGPRSPMDKTAAS